MKNGCGVKVQYQGELKRRQLLNFARTIQNQVRDMLTHCKCGNKNIHAHTHTHTVEKTRTSLNSVDNDSSNKP